MRGCDGQARKRMYLYAGLAAAAGRIGYEVWDRWPRPGVFSGVPRAPPPPRPVRPRAPRHQWQHISGPLGTGCYQCVVCQRRTNSLAPYVLGAACRGPEGLLDSQL